MKLYFRRSGGFAPIFMGCNIDTAENALADVEELILSSGIINETSKKVPQARDVYFYTFDIEIGEQKNKVTFDQLSVPEKVQPLLDYCMKHAKNMMPE